MLRDRKNTAVPNLGVPQQLCQGSESSQARRRPKALLLTWLEPGVVHVRDSLWPGGRWVLGPALSWGHCVPLDSEEKEMGSSGGAFETPSAPWPRVQSSPKSCGLRQEGGEHEEELLRLSCTPSPPRGVPGHRAALGRSESWPWPRGKVHPSHPCSGLTLLCCPAPSLGCGQLSLGQTQPSWV